MAPAPQKRGADLQAPARFRLEGDEAAIAFELRNSGAASPHPSEARPFLDADVYRLTASVAGRGWDVQLLNGLAAVKAGSGRKVAVYASAAEESSRSAVVTLRAVSESDRSRSATAAVRVSR